MESNREKIGLDHISCVPFLGYNLVKQNFRGLATLGGGDPSDEARFRHHAATRLHLTNQIGTRGRVQILLTDKSPSLKLGIQLEHNLPQGSGNQIPRVVV